MILDSGSCLPSMMPSTAIPRLARAARLRRLTFLLPILCLALVALVGCPSPAEVRPGPEAALPAAQAVLEPPVAPRIPHVQSIHGVELTDDYYWLRERDNPAVMAYLEAENAYTDAMMAHTEELQETLYQEMLGRIQETDLSAPYRKDDYWYYTRTEEGQAYSLFCRRQGSLEGPEEVLLDQNALAEGQEYLEVGFLEVSPDHRWLAYGVDTTGSELYTAVFKELESGQELEQTIENVSYSLVWANDNRTVFYTVQDDTYRPYQLYRYVVGADPDTAELVYQEDDNRFYLEVEKTRSEGYIIMSMASSATTEAWVLPADDPAGTFQLVEPRVAGIEYYVEHHSDRFYIVTNRGDDLPEEVTVDQQPGHSKRSLTAPVSGRQADTPMEPSEAIQTSHTPNRVVNFRLLEAPVSSPGRESWVEVIPHRPEVQLVSVSAFADYLVIRERADGLPRIRIRHLPSGEEHAIDFPESAYNAVPENNPEFHSTTYRLRYTSLVTPDTVYDYHMDTRQLEVLKERPVIGYDREAYHTERIWATAPDGVEVPITLVYRGDLQLDGTSPALLEGYGAYGWPYDPYFSSARLSLLDRGFVYALAHVRGGGELGRPWYEDGKLENKPNTFTDFIACAERLIEAGYTSPQRLTITGASAGGLLIGASVNQRPELFAAVVAEVPFVDLINTMLDETIPLTANEWEEWGDPRTPTFFEVMYSYSPYDNVRAQDYPAMLITAGLNDPRVAYWEPTKWAARLRALKTDSNRLLLRTNMGAGHFGSSGRYGQLAELAFEFAFILDELGANQ
ncbi:MAG: S9 family peptidase [Bradymonadales bacterium]|nr:S9 family peptidase [Bradymonadales bacterium]